MTAAISRLRFSFREALAPAGFLIFALAVGVVTGVRPLLGVALAAGLMFALIVVWDLAMGVCLFLLVTFLDVVSSNQSLSLTKAAGAVLAGSWLATMATRRGSRWELTSHVPALTGALVGFLAWSGMSAFWAESLSATSTSLLRFGLDAMLIPIVFWGIRERKHVVWLFAVFVAGTLLSVMWGLTQGKVSGGASASQVGRLSGANVEANELATLLIVCSVFACALVLVLRRAPAARALAVFAALAAMLAFFGTFSRAGIIALAVVILAGCVYGGKARPAFVALVIGVTLVGVVFFLQGTSAGGALQRLTSANTSGRADVWKVGLRMVRANPIVGVGSGNYQIAEPHYFLTSPGTISRADLIIDTPFPAHNIYLQVLAETGVIGLALFLAVIVLSIRAAVNATTMFRAQGEQSLEILGRALVVVLLGILAADFFAPDQYSKQLWLLLALCPALLAIARRSPVAQRDAPQTLIAPGLPAPSGPARQR